MKSLFCTLALLAILMMFAGCSSGSQNPVTPSESGSLDSIPIIGQTLNTATGLLGAYTLVLSDSGLDADLVPIRSSAIGESYIVSGMGFFTMTPCSDCLKIKNLSLNNDGNIVVGFIIKHPFPMGDPLKPSNARNRKDLDIFDLALLVKPVEITPDYYSGIKVDAYTGIVANADGYTRELENLLTDDAAIPYKICYESENNNRFVMGTEYQPFQVKLVPGENLVFDLYLTIGYGAAAKKVTFMSPVYYIPEFNRKAAWKVMVTPPEGSDPPALGNTWDSGNTTTDYPVTIDIYDWNHGATVSSIYPDPDNTDQISAVSDVSQVAVEIPGMTSNPAIASTMDTSTNGWDDPLTYIAYLANANGLDPGTYTGLVKVTDTRLPADTSAPYTPGALVHSPEGILLEWYQIPEFATYQTFTATVVDSIPCDPPVPTAIVPSTLYIVPGTYDDVAIYGNYFTGSGGVIDVYLDNLTDQIHGYDINVISDTELTCDFDVSSAALGSYDVVVYTQCEGRASLATVDELIVTDYPEWRCFQYNEANIGTQMVEQFFDPSSYSLKWFAPRSGYRYSGPAVTEDYVYMTENGTFWTRMASHKIVCYDMNNSGAIVWQKSINLTADSQARAFTSPCWFDDGSNGRVVVGGDRIWCFDAITGDEEWQSEEPYSFFADSPKYVDGKIYISSSSSRMFCVDAMTGAEVWVSDPAMASYESTPTIIGDLIYVGYSTFITCLNRLDGSLVWQSGNNNAVSIHWSSPYVVNGRLYYASWDGVLTCLDINNSGSLIWQYWGTDYWISALAHWVDPSDGKSVLYVTTAGSSDGGVIAIKDQGTTPVLLWQSPDFYSDSSPVIINDIVYAGSTSGDWYGYTVNTGTQVFHELLSGAARSAAGFAFDRMVVPTNDGIYVFE